MRLDVTDTAEMRPAPASASAAASASRPIGRQVRRAVDLRTTSVNGVASQRGAGRRPGHTPAAAAASMSARETSRQGLASEKRVH